MTPDWPYRFVNWQRFAGASRRNSGLTSAPYARHATVSPKKIRRRVRNELPRRRLYQTGSLKFPAPMSQQDGCQVRSSVGEAEAGAGPGSVRELPHLLQASQAVFAVQLVDECQHDRIPSGQPEG